MNKSIKDVLTVFNFNFSNKQYSIALRGIEEVLETHKFTCVEEYKKCAVKYSKAANKLHHDRKTLKKAFTFLLKSMNLYSSSHKRLTNSQILHVMTTAENLANIYNTQQKYQLSLQYLKRVLELSEDHQTTRKILLITSKIRINISTIFGELKKYSESLTYAKLGLESSSDLLKLLFQDKTPFQLTPKEVSKHKKAILVMVSCYLNLAIA